MSGKINLIYIDPPFFSKAAYDAVINIKSSDGKKKCSVKYFAYDDIWRRDMTGYLKMLCQRLLLMKELLAEDGTIWVHLDWHAVHYVKIFMDEIFGEDNFVNEIIWHYKSGGSGKRHFSRKHDTILVYSLSLIHILKSQHVEFRWNSAVSEFIYDEKLSGIRIRDVNTGEISQVECDGVFISVGRRPETGLLKDQIDLDPSGYILSLIHI